jgi:sugar/nucleoside kinase (ribokinase family)
MPSHRPRDATASIPALSTTRDGAQESMPSRHEVDALLDRGW